MTDSPVIDDMEEKDSENIEYKNTNAVADLAEALEVVLSEKHFSQKSVLSTENIQGLIGLDMVQAHMLRSFGYSFPSLKVLKESKLELSVSKDGRGRDDIIEIFRSIQTNIVSGVESLGSRMLGKGR